MENNDLQKAIDDITNATSVDPVFSEPVAAQQAVVDDGAPIEAVGPFLPEQQPMPQPVMPQPAMQQPMMQPAMPQMTQAPQMPMMDMSTPMPMQFSQPSYNYSGMNVWQVKESALRDLRPIIDKINIDPTQKFKIYREMFETLHDTTALESAYNVARLIQNEDERANSLLYLLDTIEKI